MVNHIVRRAGRNKRKPGCAECSKSLVAAVSGAGGVRRYDPEMVRGARTQPADVRDDILVGVPSPNLDGRGLPVAVCCAILKIHGGDPLMRINGTVQGG